MPTVKENWWTAKVEVRGRSREEVLDGLQYLVDMLRKIQATGGADKVPDTDTKLLYWLDEEELYTSL